MKSFPETPCRKMLLLPLIVLVMAMLACIISVPALQGNGAPSPTSPGATANNPSLPAVPAGWKVSTDSTGTCRVSTPPDWQPGLDFFLESGKSDPGLLPDAPGHFPPRGQALWPAGEGASKPQGLRFQIRSALVDGEHVCSVFRIQSSVDFTDSDKSRMAQVGATLEEVHQGAIPVPLLALLAAWGPASRARTAQLPPLPDFNIKASIFDGQTSDPQSGDSQTLDEKSDSRSSDGEHGTDEQSNRGNPDGSYHDHEQQTYTDGQGNKVWHTRDTYTAADGSRTVHDELLVKTKGGHCEKTVTDEAYDTHGNLKTKPTVTKTTVACPVFSLRVDFSGESDIGDEHAKYGPNSETINLEYNDGTHTGNYEGNFDVSVTGPCEGVGMIPVKFNVSATEDDLHDMNFSIDTSIGFKFPGLCLKGARSVNVPPVTTTLNFMLPGEEGASKAYGTGDVTITFTLLQPEP